MSGTNVSRDRTPVQFAPLDATLFEELGCEEFPDSWSQMLDDELWLAQQPPPNFPEWLVGQAELYESSGTAEGRFVGKLLSDLADAAFALKAETVLDFQARDEVMRSR